MKKNLLILLVMTLVLFKLDAYSQCTPTSAAQVYNTQFAEPGGLARYGGYMCFNHDTLIADTTIITQNNYQFRDGDGYGIRLVAGSNITISIFNSTEIISITMNDTSCSGTAIGGAYAAPNINNSLIFTAPYSGLFHIVFNKNGLCGTVGTQRIGSVMVVLNNAGSISCPATPANDNICGAVAMSNGITYTADNSLANYYDVYDSVEVVANGYTCSPPNNTMWYSYSPTVTSYYNFTFSSPACGLYGRTGLILLGGTNCTDTVTTASCLNSLNNAGSSVTSKLLMNAGTTYYFMVDGRASATGVFNVMIDLAPPPPANDTICGAVTMTLNTTYNGDNTDAYPTDPRDADVQAAGYNCSNSISGSMWYKFTPAVSGNYSINMASFANVGLSTMVSYYTATSCNSTLNYIRCYQGPSGFNLTRNATYVDRFVGGTTYYFMIEGANNGNTAGTFTIQIANAPSSPANDTICGATQLIINTPVLDDNSTAITPEETANTIIAAGYTNLTCGTPNYVLWYKFTPSDTANYIIETTSPATGGIRLHVGVFSASACDTNSFGSTGKGCYPGCNVGTTADDTIKLNKGTTYYIMIDGYEATQSQPATPKGQFTIEIKDMPTGIYSLLKEDNGIIIAPNPTNNFVRVKFEKQLSSDTKIEIVDLLGRLMYSSTMKAGTTISNIDLSNFASGNYFVKISNEKSILYHEKIIKQ
ncbi:MAG: hypothetical protein RL065_65 [Bacteroidota bacterium]|jgi:hypothetical protein